MVVYFIGIGGTAMGHAAVLLRQLGHEVLGSDQALYPPMSDVLESEGIKHFNGYDAKRLSKINPDLIVVGNAMSRGNQELEWVLSHPDTEMLSLPELIRKLLLKNKTPIVVTGTHGKTTTSSMLAYLLKESQCDPSWFIGGVPKSLGSGAHLSNGDPFVIEGDEYDSAFFDKRSKFIHYQPFIATINNIEMDHADIFRDVFDVRKTFAHFIKLIPQEGYLIVNGDDANISSLLPVDWCKVLTVGLGPKNDLIISNFKESADGCRFSLTHKGVFWCEQSLSVIGLFNARNAAMAILSAAIYINPHQPTAFNPAVLSDYKGVVRRQECIYQDACLSVFEDFAHHPSSLEATIHSFKSIYPLSRLLVCFEPRSNTARSALFQEAFKNALLSADLVKIGAIEKSSQIQTGTYLDTQQLAHDLNVSDIEAKAYTDNQLLLSSLEDTIATARERDLHTTVLFLTNGSFGGIIELFVNGLKDQ